MVNFVNCHWQEVKNFFSNDFSDTCVMITSSSSTRAPKNDSFSPLTLNRRRCVYVNYQVWNLFFFSRSIQFIHSRFADNFVWEVCVWISSVSLAYEHKENKNKFNKINYENEKKKKQKMIFWPIRWRFFFSSFKRVFFLSCISGWWSIW